MTTVLYLFSDTNVFLQCKPLDEADWESFGRWDRIEVVVTRPVQTEIDSLKGKGNSRQASRARAATTLLRRLLNENVSFIVLSTKPLVHFVVRLDLRPDSSAASSLNYDARDDQLVGTAVAFQSAHPEVTVRVLTDDTGVMFSTKAVGLNYIEIPQVWLLPPETDDAEKREKALLDQIAQYQKTEPQFRIDLIVARDGANASAKDAKQAHNGKVKGGANREGKVERLTATLSMYSPLTNADCGALMTRLIQRFPQASDFGPTEPQERRTPGDPYTTALYGFEKEVFTPSTAQEIEAYKEAYSEWKARCEEQLQKLHKALNCELEWPLLVASIINSGSRPADDALVVIEAQGDLGLVLPKKGKGRVEEEAEEQSGLPRPPSAPKGTWKRVRSYSGLMDMSRGLAGLGFGSREYETIVPHAAYRPEPPDPNAFYWKDGRKGLPSKRLALTCQQWRHAQAAEEFQQAVVCPLKPGDHSGLVTVTVHAANLTAPAIARLPVRITIEEVSCKDLASAMVEEL